MTNIFYLGIAAISGAAMALQGTLNSALGKIIGVLESTLVVHLIGTIAVLAIMLVIGVGFGNFAKLGQVPWYAFLGGLLSVIIIFAVVTVMPKIGVSNATTAIIVAQISTAVLIDSLGVFGMKRFEFHYIDILGIVLLVAGARILLMD